MEMTATVNQMLVLFFVLVVGFAARRLGIMTEATDKLLSKLVVNITVPCTIVVAITDGGGDVPRGQAAMFLLICVAVYAIALLLSFAVPTALRAARRKMDDDGLVSFMTAFGNVAFMGFPVCQAIFGDGSLFYVAMFNIPFTLLVYSVGIVMVSGKHGKLDPKIFLNPSLVSAIAAIALFVSGARLPGILSGGIEIIGRMTTPSAMLIIGSSLAVVSPRAVFAERRLYYLALMKLVVIPAVTWLVMRRFITDPLALGVLTALSGMPSATSAPMLAFEYGGNARLA
ncbi:MAG: AEC family transporter, partial [Oscillospiraceae bacterium]|nr:AEC family transporter [Oscillospiraceae bacterium]